jgi:hypothetical protein
VFSRRDKNNLEAIPSESPKSLLLRRWHDSQQRLAIFNFETNPTALQISPPAGKWKKQFDSSDLLWGGPGGSAPDHIEPSSGLQLTIPASSFVVYQSPPEVR